MVPFHKLLWQKNLSKSHADIFKSVGILWLKRKFVFQKSIDGKDDKGLFDSYMDLNKGDNKVFRILGRKGRIIRVITYLNICLKRFWFNCLHGR